MRFRLFTVFAAAGLLLVGCALEETPMEGGSSCRDGGHPDPYSGH